MLSVAGIAVAAFGFLSYFAAGISFEPVVYSGSIDLNHFVSTLTPGVAAVLAQKLDVPEELTSVQYPLPQVVRRDDRRRMYASWAMLFGLVDKMLEMQDEGRMPMRLKDVRGDLKTHLIQTYGFDNVEDSESWIKIQDLLMHLEVLGLAKEERKGVYALTASQETLETWARLDRRIEKKLRTFFDENGNIKKG